MESLQRLKVEHKRISRLPLVNIGCTVGFFEEENFYRWKCTFLGAKDSLYMGGMFYLELIFPENYPKVDHKYVF